MKFETHQYLLKLKKQKIRKPITIESQNFKNHKNSIYKNNPLDTPHSCPWPINYKRVSLSYLQLEENI